MKPPSPHPSTHASEVAAGLRFAFGANWARFLSVIDESRIGDAQRSLQRMLDVERLDGLDFLDIGSGSGLFSLAAHRLGARVHSFDFDPRSVACTMELKRRFAASSPPWHIESGSALDADYLRHLGRFDVVYSWGVLHHTGNMQLAFENVAPAVKEGGLLFISIYNDQGWISRYWTLVKRLYNANVWFRFLMIALHVPYLVWARWLVRRFAGRGPLPRGMSIWHDMHDWLGGYPFEVARPEGVLRWFRAHGFELQELVTCGGRMGCNEFVFRRSTTIR